MKALVLFSGGLDSSTCLALAVKKYGAENVVALSIYYGQKHNKVYYNLDMAVIVDKMHSLGYAAEYWVRPDGVKMFGPFVMVAAGYDVHPLGSLVETSVGTAMVVDTGGFAKTDPYLIDIATVW